MTQDLKAELRRTGLEGKFFTYPGNESLHSYDKTDPLQSYYSNLRTKARRAAVRASRRAIAAPTAPIAKFDTIDAILSLRPLQSPVTDAQFNAGLGKMSTLLRATSTATQIGVEDIKGRSRDVRIVRARHIFFWLCRHYTSCSFPQIGNYLLMDHSTVVHGVKKVSRSIALYPEIKKIKALLGAGE